LVFSHARVRPLTYREPLRFETMPSRSIQHAWRKIVAPSPVIASLSWIPSRSALLLRDSSRAQVVPALF
jgi:hypothetical protein